MKTPANISQKINNVINEDEGVGFSNRIEMTPKEFVMQKEPTTNIERVAVLAYYLTHYRDTPHFKTLDISKLNTEAAQQKFSNPTHAAREATRKGMLVPASQGKKQLSAIGEQYVQALPDRETVKKISRKFSKRKRTKKKRNLNDKK